MNVLLCVTTKQLTKNYQLTQSLILNAHSKTPFEPKYGLELNCFFDDILKNKCYFIITAIDPPPINTTMLRTLFFKPQQD